MKRTANYNLPYVEPTDYIRQYPANVSAPLAQEIDKALKTLDDKMWVNTTNFPSGYDWNLVTELGIYPIWSQTNSPTPSAPETWTVLVCPTPVNTNVLQVAFSWTNPGKYAVRRKNGTAWGTWTVYFPALDIANTLTEAKNYADNLVSSIPPPATTADLGVHQHALRLNQLRNRRPAVRLGGKAAVTLICDHGTNNFADIVLPALRSRGLTCTLALNSQMYNAANYDHYDYEKNTSWSQIKAWHDNDGIEIANHGRTHKDATGAAAIRLEIEGGRKELETNLPGVPIDSWVQIGTTGNGTKWDGFNDGISLDRYYETYAGRLILDSHALATGQVPHGGTPNRVYPLNGHPPIGASGYWLDAGGDALTAARTKIDEAVAAGGGVILRLHPYLIDWSNQISATELTALLDDLVTMRTAGDLEVLTYRDWSLATQ